MPHLPRLPHPPPTSILVIGAGAFGLSTALALIRRPHYSSTRITLLDASPNTPSSTPPPHTASSDTTRIIRADYADPLYADLGRKAQILWRGEWGAQGRYTESGLVLTASGPAGKDYVQKALKNVRHLPGISSSDIQELPDKSAIASAMRCNPGTAIGSGETGYLNRSSGWADATATMYWLRQKVAATGRVLFLTGEAIRLMHSDGRVLGAELASGERVTAELTILATGAWTGKLVDLRGIASARGQVVAYYTVTPQQAEPLRDMPVHFNMSSGFFCFPPTKTSEGGAAEIKVARHTFGYSNPVTIAAPFGTRGSGSESESAIESDGDDKHAPPPPPPPSNPATITISLPTFPSNLPPPDITALTTFLLTTLPILSSSTSSTPLQPTRTRLCYYLDTSQGDFLVSYHPTLSQSSRSLFLATGGSGHAFKFLPVLGEKVVDILEGKVGGEGVDIWREKWAWPVRRRGDEVWCEDGSRSGVRGVSLGEALRGGGGSKL